MKTKLITTLTALLMLVGIGAQAQTDNQTPSSAESTDLEGDLNHDNKVDVADVTYLVNIILKNKPLEGCFWYLSNEALTEDNAPHDPAAQDAQDHKGWRELDPNTDRLLIPYVETDDESAAHWCIATPSALGFNTIVNSANMDQTGGFTHSNVTVNNVEYDVWILKTTSPRISYFYLIKSNNVSEETTGTYWYLSNEALTEDNAPHDPAAQDAEDHKGWRELDPNTTRLEVPYVEMEDRSNVNWCIAVPAALGFTKIVNTGDMDVTNGFEHSNITVNNVEYDVWTIIDPGWRISRFYLIK